MTEPRYGLTVLLIEDNPGDARLIREMLIHDTGDSYMIQHVDTLREGIAILETVEFDVALVDLTLPDGSGLETPATVRAAAPRLPIVVLTGFDDRGIGLQALQIGAQDYLVKGDTTSATLQRALRYAVERKRIEADEQEHLATIEALRDSLAALTSTLDLDEVLDRVLDNISRVIPHQAATVMLVENSQVRVVRARVEGVGQQVHSGLVPVDSDSLLTAVIRNGETLRLDDQPCPHPEPNSVRAVMSLLAAPIQLAEQVIGVISVYRAQSFSEADSQRLRLFAEQAAIALRNARQFWDTSALAALQERQRLARDLHDSVTQTLFSASVIAETVLKLWPGRPERIEPMLRQLHQLNTGALAEMRVLLLELRPTALEGVSLHDLLVQLVTSMRSRKKLDILFEFDEYPALPFEVKEALYRITQEALNNVLKHSRATHAEVRLKYVPSDNALLLCICDNGGGFDEGQPKSTSLGMTIMHERAQAIGAALNIDNQPDRGVTVQVRLSIHPIAEVTQS